ncbi:DarT1-associated NADAR antitoxin family protein [Cereibacter sphaeroides]|uniref:DarT1-associated NADAR antitoxin family protein n=1 Tax=Cereibacter sphaeroides TaxID=1063 RepID=UPI001F22228D|nr:hypothetical protein [Cereibacter sphaeroides]
MAQRYIYVPAEREIGVKEIALDFEWHSGFSAVQKRKSIKSLHDSANKAGYAPILEISSKSELAAGVEASAFSLTFRTKASGKCVSVESAFQGSKVFAFSGPFPELYDMPAREAKKEIRLRQRGELKSFCFFGREFPLRPRTFFYDWLYINTLHKNEELSSQLCGFAGFSDIEFNPEKSVNCQAFSAALYVSLVQAGHIDQALASEEEFLNMLTRFYERRERNNPLQRTLI